MHFWSFGDHFCLSLQVGFQSGYQSLIHLSMFLGSQQPALFWPFFSHRSLFEFACCQWLPLKWNCEHTIVAHFSLALSALWLLVFWALGLGPCWVGALSLLLAPALLWGTLALLVARTVVPLHAPFARGSTGASVETRSGRDSESKNADGENVFKLHLDDVLIAVGCVLVVLKS